MDWILAYHLIVTVFLLLVTANIFINWFLFVTPRPRRFDAAGSTTPLVSVLVPARNEGKRITPCLRSTMTPPPSRLAAGFRGRSRPGSV